MRVVVLLFFLIFCFFFCFFGLNLFYCVFVFLCVCKIKPKMHYHFAKKLAMEVFDGQLKSYQKAFATVTPQCLGLPDFRQIRDSYTLRNTHTHIKLLCFQMTDHQTRQKQFLNKKTKEDVLYLATTMKIMPHFMINLRYYA